MSKYAEPNDNGEKPYIVTLNDWGRVVERLVYANNVNDAKYRAKGRGYTGLYASSCRRALAHEVERAR